MGISRRNIFFFTWSVIMISLMVILGFNFASPLAVSFPTQESRTVRIQLIIDGEDVDFTKSDFQTPLEEVCEVDSFSGPMYFTEEQPQLLRLNWQDVSGRIFLKNYGFSNKGSFAGYLGIRLDSFPKVTPVPIFSDILNEPEKPYNYYVYTGNQLAYQRRDESEFLNKSLVNFFRSDNQENTELSNLILTPQVNAQVATENGDDVPSTQYINTQETQRLTETPTAPRDDNNSGNTLERELFGPIGPTYPTPVITKDAEEIQKIDSSSTKGEDLDLDLLGTVVIFIQNEEPSVKQVSDRFLNLTTYTPLNC